MHPRNRHQDRYDLPALTAAYPALRPFVRSSPAGAPTVDFADPAAVRALNAALLKSWYGLERWELPAGALCPPVPGRADHVHHAADLLAGDNGGKVPRGDGVRVLDVGVGANCIYPIIGRGEYGWRFVGVDVDEAALAAAWKTVEADPNLRAGVALRRQKAPERIIKGVVREDERFDLSLCNPPFNASPEEVSAGALRKRRNLGLSEAAPANFGGEARELWCPGGESAFIGRLIEESAGLARQVLWFSTLVSKSASLPPARGALKAAKALEAREIDVEHGQKKSRLLAWTFHDAAARQAWRRKRWARA